ncbi:uncharacterized protein LOC144987743 [Oryzias latipes]|uniref:Gypsy retrotransposon integrase-like protein 1 n=1 Tax=Oryzias latipes TaxID=8090 RepID=A0A3B3HD76_ORYLA
MTRGKKTETPDLPLDDDKATSSHQEGAAAPDEPDKLEELTTLVRTLVQSQASRDKLVEKESARQDQRWKNLQHQFQMLQTQVKELKDDFETRAEQDDDDDDVGEGADDVQLAMPTSCGPVPPTQRGPILQKQPKILPLSPEDDIEHYLMTFERIATVCRWPKEEWAIQLIPLLTGKARSAYVLMDFDDSEDYEKVKEVILAKYEITAETYRKRFRALDINPGETPRELYVRLRELFNKWVKPEACTVKEISEKLILEQFLRMMNPEMEIWIRERDPQSAEEASRLAEVFLSARSGRGRPNFGRDSYFSGRSKSYAGERGGQTHSRMHNSPRQFSAKAKESRCSFSSSKQDVRCYQCNEIGHTQYTCPATRQNPPSLLCTVPRPSQPVQVQKEVVTVPVLINGQRKEALLDSGCFKSVVLESLVPRDLWNEATATIGCVHGDEKAYRTAEVYLTIDGQTYLMPVVLVPELPFSVILGRDVPLLFDLIQQAHAKMDGGVCETSVQAQRKPVGSDHQHAVSLCNIVTTRANAARNLLEELPFHNTELEISPVKVRKSRAQRRREKFLATVETQCDDEKQPSHVLDFQVPADIAALQRADPRLKVWFDKVSEIEGQKTGRVECLTDKIYLIKNGILYQRHGTVEALALPQCFSKKVMGIGHSIPWAGHLAFQKSLNRIANRFVWPAMYTQLKEFCASCEICQLTAPQGVARAPLQPLPLIETPFDRIGMDIVGPLEKSSSGHKYILVICDYATRYPEAFPLRSVKARQIANCLIQLFSRVGIPKEILTDCGTNFLSKLLKQVYSLLGVKGIKTTPYHPQTDGLVERFNQTLKTMLRKFVSETGTDWDQWLPYLLFAYREVPQASTGFSPFELLYGRQVRGPLDLLKDYWEKPVTDKDNVVSYVLKMRERLERMSTLAQEHMRSAQAQQKTWYDKKAKDRIFQVGQQVLLLLPTSDNKLLARWQGPYSITKRLGEVTYELYMPEKLKKHQRFHVNLLKEFQLPASNKQECNQTFFIRVADDDEEEREQLFPHEEMASSPVDVSHLQPDRQREVGRLLDAELFKETPGFTTLVQHKVHLKEDAVPRRRYYRIPERLVVKLEKEIELMLKLGVIEPSTSGWCSPVVLVPKKDGSLRFCIDFRYLNAVSKIQSYPMPRIDELLERVGKSKFITTLDLSKGYWQVALAQETKELTAFTTPYGKFQFKVMPFGLQGAPATFQRLMDEILRDVPQFAAAYLDDVIIFSHSWRDHMSHLRHVLHLIKAAGLTINPGKCVVAQQQVEYLGHVVGQGLVKPRVGKVEAIQEYPIPTTKKKVRAFVGLVGWYSKFIPHFADRAAVLTDLTRASAPNKVVWTEDCDAAFRDLKRAITSESVLYSPDFTRPFILQTDASAVGLGAVLVQEAEGERHPVLFLSRKLLDRETRYSTVEKECLAMKWAIDSLRYYLLGRHFCLETDHRALQWLRRMKDSNTRLTAWYLSLQAYDFTVQYRAGKTNCVADCLSRVHEN